MDISSTMKYKNTAKQVDNVIDQLKNNSMILDEMSSSAMHEGG